MLVGYTSNMSKLEDILGNCITEFNQAINLPADKVDVKQQLRIIIETHANEIRKTLLQKQIDELEKILNIEYEATVDELKFDELLEYIKDRKAELQKLL